LTDDILSDPTDQKDIMKIRSAPFQPQMDKVMKTLPALKKDRPHGPKAVQSAHDLTANSILTWLIVECSDARAVAAFTYIIPFL
jgi:proteasome activator subunit 4